MNSKIGYGPMSNEPSNRFTGVVSVVETRFQTLLISAVLIKRLGKSLSQIPEATTEEHWYQAQMNLSLGGSSGVFVRTAAPVSEDVKHLRHQTPLREGMRRSITQQAADRVNQMR